MVISPTVSSQGRFDKIRCWLTLHPYWTLTLIVLATLGPFLGKPFNIDDPLFIWAAHHIQANPANPYDFQVEWGVSQEPMWKVTENPPVACYYMALAAGFVGWSEVALHLAFLVPVLAAVVGTYRLARRFCGQPVLATLVMFFTPAFLVSSLTVMCDMSMLAFWVWAVVFWVEGTEQEKNWKMVAAAGLIALAELSKYYGASLVPLLAAYSLIARRPVRHWGQFLLLPLAVLLAYHIVTRELYGNSLLYNAMAYASATRAVVGFSSMYNTLAALAFTGGCLVVAAIFAPLMWRPRVLVVFLGVAIAVVGIFASGAAYWGKYGLIGDATRPAVAGQEIFWVASGLSLLTLAAAGVWQQRDARSWLLSLWLLGTFVFAALVNWTVNARSILPMTPAAGILIARCLEAKNLFENRASILKVVFCLVTSLILAMAVLLADCLTAFAVRHNALSMCTGYLNRVGTLWFEGHWGFQYYAEQAGAKPEDFKNLPPKPGDAVAVPSNNTDFRALNPRNAHFGETYMTPGPWLVTTTDQSMGANFYASSLGPLPFAFGRVSPEVVHVYIFRPMEKASLPAKEAVRVP